MDKDIVDTVQRDLGRMETEIKSLHSTMGEVKDDMKEIRRSFDELKGGTRFLMVAASGIGGVIALVISWFALKH